LAGNASTSQSAEIDRILDAAPLGSYQIKVAILCGLVAMLDGFDTQSIAFVAPVLGKAWGIAPASFGLVFSAGLLGIMVGQLIGGPMADRWGRRPVILLSTAIFAVLTLATALTDTIASLLLLRFLTGMGLGAATPNLITLTCEVAPPRSRGTMITAMFAGFPMGAAVGGLISSRIIPAFGWESVFVLGGIAPLLLLPVLMRFLPESPHFLFRTQRNPSALAAMLKRIAGSVEMPVPTAAPAGPAASPNIASLLRPGLARTTLALWFAYFNSLLMVYFLMSWLPTVARASGMALDTAIISAVFLNLGGALGGIVLGYVADRFGGFRVLAAGYAIAGVCIALIGQFAQDEVLLIALAFGAGLFTIGGQTAMNAATAAISPADFRATGLGSALAIGRIGSIAGPSIGGILLALQLDISVIFLAAAIPAVLTAGIALWLGSNRASN